MLNLIIKLIVFPIVVLIAAYLFPNVAFAHASQPIVIGFTAALASHLMEWALLQKGTFWISNAADFIAGFLIVYFLAYFYTGAEVTMIGALLTSLLLTAVEYFQHLWLLRTGRARREPVLK